VASQSMVASDGPSFRKRPHQPNRVVCNQHSEEPFSSGIRPLGPCTPPDQLLTVTAAAPIASSTVWTTLVNAPP